MRHIQPNYSFTEIYINWIASWNRSGDTEKEERKREKEQQKMTVHSLINEMRFILDDNFVFNGPNLFILTQRIRFVSIVNIPFFFHARSKTKCPFFSYTKYIQHDDLFLTLTLPLVSTTLCYLFDFISWLNIQCFWFVYYLLIFKFCIQNHAMKCVVEMPEKQKIKAKIKQKRTQIFGCVCAYLYKYISFFLYFYPFDAFVDSSTLCERSSISTKTKASDDGKEEKIYTLHTL